jgi:predicted O-methyltransferase YrrM
MNFIDKEIEDYAISKCARPSIYCQRLADETRKREEWSEMLVGELEGSFLGFLIRSLGVVRVLEVGTFTGYSALAMAENLPPGGEVHTIDIEKRDWAREIVRESPHAGKIHYHQGEGLAVIPELEAPFDLVFIDADKQNYLAYLELALDKLSDRGIVVVDNVLWSGRVLKDQSQLDKEDTSTPAIQKINQWASSNPHLYTTMLPIRDGLLLIKKC